MVTYQVFHYDVMLKQFESYKTASRWCRSRANRPESYEIGETMEGGRILKLWKFNEHTRRFQRWDIDRGTWLLKI
jgi:hypothetical protein